MKKIIIRDTTLRDGMQSPGLFLSTEDRWKLAEMIAGTGVDEIEAGIPAVGGEESRFIAGLISRGLNTRQWCRTRAEDLDAALALGCTKVHISIPVSDIILGTLGWSWKDAVQKARVLIQEYAPKFVSMSLGLQDVARAPDCRLSNLGEVFGDLPLDFIRLADTVGILTPEETSRRIAMVRSGFCGDIEFHPHNDFGLATANALAGVTAGLSSLSGTIDGVGERAGNLRLGEIGFLLERQGGVFTSVNLGAYLELSALFSRMIGRPIPVDRPLVGGNAFRHSSGIHLNSLKKNPLSYQPCDPAQIPGQKMQFAVNHYSGKTGSVKIESGKAQEAIA
jgi:homocitrate synthase NifV